MVTTHPTAVECRDARPVADADSDGGEQRCRPSAPAVVVLAVKSLAVAKSRLAAVLGPDDRERLVLAMFIDTLEAASRAHLVGSTVVVTPDSRVAAEAVRAGAGVIADPGARAADGNDPLNAAYLHGARTLAASESVIVALQADLPAMTPAELDAALRIAPSGRSVVIDHTGTGTTALIARGRGTDLRPHFGTGSARAHLASGAQALRGSQWPGLRTDVDTIDDLRTVLDYGIGPRTLAEVERIDTPARRLRLRAR